MSKTQIHSVYRKYKYFQNLLRKCNVIESLFVIWGYSRNLLFDFDFPSNIERPPFYNPHGDRYQKSEKGIPEFEQEYLVKEIIMNCSLVNEDLTLRKHSYLGKLINYLRDDLTTEVEKYAIKDDFLIEFNRLLHNQFKWNRGLERASLFRNFKVFSEHSIDQIVINKYGINVYDFYFATITLYTLTAMHYRISSDFTNKFPNELKKVFSIYLELFSIDLLTLKKELLDLREMNENLFYTFNPLLEKPIIKYENDILCPFQLFIYSQGAGGIYYLLCKEKGFDEAIGNSFQAYIGEVLNKSITNHKLKILEEKSWSKPLKHTTDWIIYDQDSIAFIECKCKRLTISSKFNLEIQEGLNDDLDKMADFIIQLYKTYLDYMNNEYPHINYIPDQIFLPIVVTLEAWNITWNPKIMDLLNEKVRSKFEKNKIDIGLLEKYPYHIYSSEDLENNIQIINKIGLTSYIDKFNIGELNNYKKDFKYEFIFQDEFREAFTKEIDKYDLEKPIPSKPDI